MNFRKKIENNISQTIVLYGTSLTEFGSWTVSVEQYFKNNFPGLVEIVNSGKSSMSSIYGVEHINDLVVDFTPNVVLIEFSINDAWDHYDLSLEKSRENLLFMTDTIKYKLPLCEIILMTMNPPSSDHQDKRLQLDSYYEIYREVAVQAGFGLIDHYPKWIKLQNENPLLFKKFLPDGIHPNEEGHNKITTPAVINYLTD